MFGWNSLRDSVRNYFYPEVTYQIKLYPTLKFIKGQSYFCILQKHYRDDNNSENIEIKDFVLPKNTLIKKIYVKFPEELKNKYPIQLTLQHHILFNNIFFDQCPNHEIIKEFKNDNSCLHAHHLVLKYNFQQIGLIPDLHFNKLMFINNSNNIDIDNDKFDIDILNKFEFIIEIENINKTLRRSVPSKDKYLEKAQKNIWLNTYYYHNDALNKHKCEPDMVLTGGKMFKNKKSVGLAFSGGGGRSHACTLGYLRALHWLGELDDVKYISGVSGSTWTLVPYFYNDTGCDLGKLLGVDKFIERHAKLGISMRGHKLDRVSCSYEGEYLDHETYLGCVLPKYSSNSLLIRYFMDSYKYLAAGEKTRVWCYMLGRVLLAPFGLLNTCLLCPEKQYSQNHLDKFPLNINQEKCHIHYSNQGPMLLVSASVVDHNKPKSLINTDFKHMIFSPLYSGIVNDYVIDGHQCGQYFLHTYSFHPRSTYHLTRNLHKMMLPTCHPVDDIHRFNLFDIIGTSSTAFGIVMEKLGIEFATPDYRIPTLHKVDHTHDTENFELKEIKKEIVCEIEKEVEDSVDIQSKIESHVIDKCEELKRVCLIDGGIIDNTGILPLLQRGIEEITLFVNSKYELKKGMTIEEIDEKIDMPLKQIFTGNCEEVYLGGYKYVNRFQMFSNEADNDWMRLLESLKNNIDNKGIGYAEIENLWTLRNHDFKISRYLVSKLKIFYLYPTKSWYDNRIDDDVKFLLTKKDYKEFPYIKTIFEEGNWVSQLLYLSQEKVNLLADLCCWTYLEVINDQIYKNKTKN